jgi:nucleotide-binding universal stress UspA family protein
MFRNVIVGIHEEHGGGDAIALARQLVAKDGKLTLAYVYPGYAAFQARSNPEAEAREQEHAKEILEATRDEAGLTADLKAKGSPTVGRGLHELAEECAADLVVAGSTHHGLIGRVCIGNDTHDALNGAPCPVAVPPTGYAQRPQEIKKIVIGYDGSPDSKHAVGVARALAAELGATLSAVQAVSWPTYMFANHRVSAHMIRDAVDEAEKEIAELGDIEGHALYGDAAEELAAYSASADLLVVGSRGYGPAGRLVHGSTSDRLAESARCPLIVLTRLAGAPEATQSGAAEATHSGAPEQSGAEPAVAASASETG